MLINHDFWTHFFMSNIFGLSVFNLSNATASNNVFKERYKTEQENTTTR
jgi:hypothetical protein